MILTSFSSFLQASSETTVQDRNLLLFQYAVFLTRIKNATWKEVFVQFDKLLFGFGGRKKSKNETFKCKIMTKHLILLDHKVNTTTEACNHHFFHVLMYPKSLFTKKHDDPDPEFLHFNSIDSNDCNDDCFCITHTFSTYLCYRLFVEPKHASSINVKDSTVGRDVFMNILESTKYSKQSLKNMIGLDKLLEVKKISIPTQKNACDCGLYVIFWLMHFVLMNLERSYRLVIHKNSDGKTFLVPTNGERWDALSKDQCIDLMKKKKVKPMVLTNQQVLNCYEEEYTMERILDSLQYNPKIGEEEDAHLRLSETMINELKTDGKIFNFIGLEMYSIDGERLEEACWVKVFDDDVKIPTEASYVELVLSKDQINKTVAKVLCNRRNFYELTVNEGNPKISFGSYPPPPAESSKPKVRFQQGNDPHCVACSWASAMCEWKGNWALATKVHQQAQNMVVSISAYDSILKITEAALEEFYSGRYTAVTVVDPAIGDDCLDVLMQKSPHPMLVSLASKEGFVSHVIAIHAGNGFDSNLKRARTISQEFLDWCVSPGSLRCKCSSIRWMIQIVPKPPKFLIFSDHNAPHYGLAQLFTFLDYPDIAQSFLSVALAFPCSNNVFMGLA